MKGGGRAENRNVPIFGAEFPALLVVWLLAGAGCSSTPVPYNPAKLPPQATRPHSQQESLRTRGEAIADYALTLRGTPYRYGGSTRAGFDWSGLVFFSHQQLGVTVPRTSRDQAEEARQIKRGKLRRGDLVFFKIGSRRVNHVGIYIGDGMMVHASTYGTPVRVAPVDNAPIHNVRRY